MLKTLATRLGGAVVGLLLLTIATFIMVRMIPGSVVDVMLGTENVSEQTREAYRDRYGLNDSLPVQYEKWMSNIVRGDFGKTVRSRQPVSHVLLEKAVPSLQLATVSLFLSLVMSLILGTAAGLRRNKAIDKIATLIALLGMSVPDFVVGLLLIIFVASKFDFFPIFGYEPLSAGFVPWFSHIILPAVSLSFALSGFLTRITRSSVAETLQEDYVRTAEGKGLHRWTVIRRHIVRPSLIPVTTTGGLLFVAVIGGIVVIEQVFAIPGMGRLILDGIRFRDYGLIQAATLFIGCLAILVSLLVDFSYRLLDPRLRG